MVRSLGGGPSRVIAGFSVAPTVRRRRHGPRTGDACPVFRIAPLLVKRRAAHLQFCQQMGPFVCELSGGDGERRGFAGRSDFPLVEGVAAGLGLGVNGLEVRGDGRQLRRMILESLQLRMVAVAARFSTQYRLRQQRFPPQRDQSLGIEVFRMQGPEAHVPGRSVGESLWWMSVLRDSIGAPEAGRAHSSHAPCLRRDECPAWWFSASCRAPCAGCHPADCRRR